MVVLRITKLAAANVTIEFRDSGMLRLVTTLMCSREETFTTNLAPVRVAPSMCGFIASSISKILAFYMERCSHLVFITHFTIALM